MQFYIILVMMTLVGAFAAFFLKKAANGNPISNIFNNINLYIGITLYLVCSVINIYVLKYLEYSIVLPLTSITYVWTALIAKYLLKEVISSKKVVGVLLIIIGAFFIVK